MGIEEFVETLREGERQVRVARIQQNETTAGTAANYRALIDHRRCRDSLSTLIASHPDLVARILVRAWETCESIDDARAESIG